LNEYPKITVVVPVRNEEEFIAQTLGYILSQDYPNEQLEVIVADGESDDRTREIVNNISEADSRVRLIENPGRLSSAGRNVGIKNATGDIVTFIDGHTYIDNDQLLKNIAHYMAEKEISVLSRPQFLDTPENNFFQKAVSLARRSVIGHGLDSTIYTNKEMFVNPASSGASYRRDLFDKIGIYDERFDACEDVELNYRAHLNGYKSYTSPDLAVYYYPRSSIKGLFRQLKRYGQGRYRLFRKHKSSLSLGTMVPVLMTLGIPLGIVVSLLWNPFVYPFIIALAFYLLLITGWSLAIALRKGIRYFFILPLIYPTIHLALGYGFIKEFLFGKRFDFK